MDGGSRVAAVLKAHGVKQLYTLIGGHISPILVSSKRMGIRVIDHRHEVNAIFAADASARLTGTPGVAAVTAGPGVTNAITAVKNAQMAQSPLVLIGGATATMLRGRGSLQDIDQMSVMAPHVKWAARPNNLREIVPAMEKAFEIAQSGVPGPVFVELAVDLLYPEETVREWYAAKTDKPNKNVVEQATSLYIKGHLAYLFAGKDQPNIGAPQPVTAPTPSRTDIRAAAKKLSQAHRPVMVLGSQTMLHPAQAQELVSAVEKLGIPTYLSGMARGLLGKGHSLQRRHKRRVALKEADVVLLCGVPSDFRLDYGAHVSRCTLISVNLSEDDLNKNRKPDIGVLADPHTFITALAMAMPVGGPERSGWEMAMKERDDIRNAEIAEMAKAPADPINPMALCQVMERHLSEKSILIGDGGDFVATASYIVSPRGPYTWLDPGVFGTLGVGAGFAMGAKANHPDHDVWLIYGDGAAGFSIMEFDSMARQGLPVIALIGNDACWTQIARDQIPTLGDDVACNLTHMRYDQVAEACGGVGFLLDDPEKMEEVFAAAVKASREGKPVIINAIIGGTDFRKGSISI